MLYNNTFVKKRHLFDIIIICESLNNNKQLNIYRQPGYD